MITSHLATVNAVLNAVSAVLLGIGFVQVKRGFFRRHRAFMLSALVASALFLTSYLIYHATVGSVPYPRHDWTRPLYFGVLIPHIIFAAVMVPFVLLAVWHALKERFDKHTRITRWLWWVWMYVSLSGVAVYLMLYQLS
jgi:putative membrane protein